MIRKKWRYDAAAVKSYFEVSDYYLPAAGEWIGRDAARLGLTGVASKEDFDKLLDNINPLTGEHLTKFTRDGRRVAFELNFNAVKDASIAWALGGERNQGDPLVKWCHKEAVKYTLGLVEADMQTYVRDQGKNQSRETRTTGSMIAWMTTHGETRVNADDAAPDMDLHEHVLVMNQTWDQKVNGGRGAWKAIEVGKIVEKLPLYEAAYHNRMAFLLRTVAGYGIERRGKAYRIVGLSNELRDLFSRRTKTIKQRQKEKEEQLGRALTAAEADQLGAKTRLGKTDMIEGEMYDYWLGKLTAAQKRELATMKGKPSSPCSVAEAVRYAMEHEFYRHGTVQETKLHETAIRRGMGWVTSLDEVKEACRRQGVLVEGGEATTRDVWAQEQFISGLAMQRGTKPPLAPHASIEALKRKGIHVSEEQASVCKHIWQSCDPVIVIEGDAGTGKTQTMQATVPGVEKPGVFLAASGSASRGTLREKGFKNANTIAMFKANARFREQARGGYVYIDEAPMAALSDIAYVLDWASKNDARVILQGDRKQHQSPQRGNLFEILEMAGVPICRLTENHRQLHVEYRQAVNKMAHGDILGGHKMIEKLGWVQQVEPAEMEKAVAEECGRYLDKGESFVVVGITHRQNDAITRELRNQLRAKGKLAAEEITLERLVPLQWTPAQKGDLAAYEGSEVIQFVRNAGPFKAGQRVPVEELRASPRPVNPESYAVYAKGTIALAAGDVLRATAGGRSIDGKRIDNGEKFVFAGLTRDGNLALKRGTSTYVVSREFKHLAYGLVDTSFKAQSETKARTIGVFTERNAPGINAAQYYVTLSRGRLSAKVFSTLPPEEMHALIQRRDRRKSATELLGPKEKARERLRAFAQQMRQRYRRLREEKARMQPGREPEPPAPTPPGKWQGQVTAREGQCHGLTR